MNKNKIANKKSYCEFCDIKHTFKVCSGRCNPESEIKFTNEEVEDILFTMSVENPSDISKWFKQFKNK